VLSADDISIVVYTITMKRLDINVA